MVLLWITGMCIIIYTSTDHSFICWSLHPSIHPSIHPLIHSFIHVHVYPSSIYPLILSFIYPSIHSIFDLLSLLSHPSYTCTLYIHSPICSSSLSVHSSSLSVHSSIHPSTCIISSIHPFIHSSICSSSLSIHSSIVHSLFHILILFLYCIYFIFVDQVDGSTAS